MGKDYSFLIDEEDAGRRIDAVLADLMEEASRSSIQKLIEEGEVFLSGTVITSKKYKVQTGDLVELSLREPVLLSAEPEDIPLEIVYEDTELLVVNKPKGMVVHPAAGNLTGTLVNAVMFHCRGRLSSINGVVRPGIVHRIDKDTSGLLLIAKTDNAHRSLADQLAAHSVTRVYKAIVYDNLTSDVGTINAPLGRDPKNRLRMAVVHDGGRTAITHYKVLERFGMFTYLEARLETGRTHQIRVHMAYIKHPLLGDTLYGPKNQRFGVTGQVLHADTIGFIHPATGSYMEFNSPLPEEFKTILERLRRT